MIRLDRIADAMTSRWGWEPIEYRRLAPRLRNIVDYLLDVPTLSEESELHCFMMKILELLIVYVIQLGDPCVGNSNARFERKPRSAIAVTIRAASPSTYHPPLQKG